METTTREMAVSSNKVVPGGPKSGPDSPELAPQASAASETASAASEADLGKQLADSHVNLLPQKQLIFTLIILCNNVLMAFLDQSALTVALSTLAHDLDAEKTINWAPTAALLANCVCQGLFGRLSDIFGRKGVLLTSMAVLAIADLACGFAQTGVQFYVFRAFAGIGNGGIQALTNVVISDIVTLEQRGKFQGILGFNVGAGNAVGPFLMSAFITHSTWRTFYHVVPGLVVAQMAVTWYFVPGTTMSSLSRLDRLRTIDFWGMLLSTAGLTLVLVPLNGGGSTYHWDSAVVVGMLVVGAVCFTTFLVVEWKVPRLPLIPMSLFKTWSLNLIMASNFLYGTVYFSFQYYVPYYFQIVLGRSELQSAVLLLPLVLMQSAMSTVAGYIISRSGHYKYVITTGFGLWLLGCGLLLIFDVGTSAGAIAGVFLVMGAGVGCTFQPSVVAAQAHVNKADRAVVIGTRNLVRYFGGALGTALASLIVSNSLLREIDRAMARPEIYHHLPAQYLDFLRGHIYTRVQISGLDSAQVGTVKKMYMKAIRNYFYFTVPVLGVCFLCSLFVRDRGLQALDEPRSIDRPSGPSGGPSPSSSGGPSPSSSGGPSPSSSGGPSPSSSDGPSGHSGGEKSRPSASTSPRPSSPGSRASSRTARPTAGASPGSIPGSISHPLAEKSLV